MTHLRKHLSTRWPDWATLAIGAWLFLSGWLLGFADLTMAMWNALLFGALVAVMSIAALTNWREWEEWIDVAIGAWLVISPWMLGFADLVGGGAGYAATLSTALSGIGVAVLAIVSVWRHRDPGLGAH